MKLTLTHADLASVDVDLMIVPIPGPDFAKDEALRALDVALDGELLRVAKLEDFTGKKGQSLTLYTGGKLKARKLRVYALGGKDATEELRSFATVTARGLRDTKSFAIHAPPTSEMLRVLIEAFLMGDYRYTEYLTGARKPKPSTTRGVLITREKPTAADRKALADATIVADAVNFARDLVNAPP
ncbi:MAG: M17 family peptidase N-terminal domain-containing protein, partial [Polyangiales bacterium]